jgi:competence transcription factor ComK
MIRHVLGHHKRILRSPLARRPAEHSTILTQLTTTRPQTTHRRFTQTSTPSAPPRTMLVPSPSHYLHTHPILACLSRSLRTPSRCPPKKVVVSCNYGGFIFECSSCGWTKNAPTADKSPSMLDSPSPSLVLLKEHSPARNQLPWKTHDKSQNLKQTKKRKNSKNSRRLDLGVSLQGVRPQLPRPKTFQISIKNKKSADSGSPESLLEPFAGLTETMTETQHASQPGRKERGRG